MQPAIRRRHLHRRRRGCDEADPQAHPGEALARQQKSAQVAGIDRAQEERDERTGRQRRSGTSGN